MYEQRGLIDPPARTAVGYRLYGGMAVAQLLRIRHLRELGLGLEQIREAVEPVPPMSLDAVLAMVQDELDGQLHRLGQLRAAVETARASVARGVGDPAWQRLLAMAAEAGRDRGHEPSIADDHPLPDTVIAGLERLASRPEWADLSHRLAELRHAGWDDPRIGHLAAGLAVVVPPALLPDELTAPAGFAVLVGRRASPAQVRCLLQAGRLARMPGHSHDCDQVRTGRLA
jgi:DNA-binding transcriptional MerR regulator